MLLGKNLLFLCIHIITKYKDPYEDPYGKPYSTSYVSKYIILLSQVVYSLYILLIVFEKWTSGEYIFTPLYWFWGQNSKYKWPKIFVEDSFCTNPILPPNDISF